MKTNKGLTLIEVLVVVLLVSLMATAGIYIVAITNRVVKKNFDEAMARDNLSRLMREMNRDIKEAVFAESPVSTSFTTTLPAGITGVRWDFYRGFIYRWDQTTGTRKEFNVIGADDYYAEGKFEYFPHGRELDSRYPSIETTISLKLMDDRGMEFQTDSITNVFYLRMDPDGFGYGNM